MINEPPLVSVISATLNAAAQIPHTLRSIAAQSGASFEWIVIDGGSKDGTLDILRQKESLISHLVTEPDAGISDAWNKACALARGDWFLFLGAGDEFAAPDTLARMTGPLRGAYPSHDLVYGRVQYISPNGRRKLEEVGVPWNQLARAWDSGRPALPAHAAIFHHRSLFSAGRKFDPGYRIAGDVHFLLRHALRKPPLFFPMTTVSISTHGISMNLRRSAELAREIRRMNRELGIVVPYGHQVGNSLLLAAKVLAGCLPAPVGDRVADLYRRLTGRGDLWSPR